MTSLFNLFTLGLSIVAAVLSFLVWIFPRKSSYMLIVMSALLCFYASIIALFRGNLILTLSFLFLTIGTVYIILKK